MTKYEFIEFSLATPSIIDKLETLLNQRKWIFQWDYLKDAIINNNVNIENIVLILDMFKDYEIRLEGKEFIKLICENINKGYSIVNIIVSFSNSEYLGYKKWTKPEK